MRGISSIPGGPALIDASLYFEGDASDALDTLESRLDYLVCLCSAWDFGILPGMEVAMETRRPQWRAAVYGCRLLTSPAYHPLREWHGLPLPWYLGRELACIRDDPDLAFIWRRYGSRGGSGRSHPCCAYHSAVRRRPERRSNRGS